MKRLENDADMPPPETGQDILAQGCQVGAVHEHRTRADPLQARQGHQQGRLAGAGGPDDADGFAALDLEVDTAQDIDRAGAAD